MDRHIPPLPNSGAAMDSAVPKRRGKRLLHIGAGAVLTALLLAAAWQWVPRGLQVSASDARLATVEKGVFRDDIVVRASAEPLNSVILDSVESGRVEEIFARDGALVKKGQLLFRLSNPQRNLELLERQAEHAQQISNLSNLRVMQEAGRTEHQRRMSDLAFALEQGEKQHKRNLRLHEQGFISNVALEESTDRVSQQRRSLAEEKNSTDNDRRVRQDAITQMETAIRGLQSGLLLVNQTVAGLAVRAPVDGMLTGFRLQIGQTVRTDQNIGRVDDPSRFKLTAQVDEFYLNRVGVGRHGSVRHGDQDYAVDVSTVYPQIREGRFTLEMVFTKNQPAVLSPGQSLDARITLGEPAQALLLPNGAFLNDTGGAWVFVLGPGGETVSRRAIQVGRRSNSQVEIRAGLAQGERVVISSYAAFGKAERLQLTN
jgi:HlyD family secretion protein